MIYFLANASPLRSKIVPILSVKNGHGENSPPPTVKQPKRAEVARLVNSLENDIKIKDSKLAALTAKVDHLENDQRARQIMDETISCHSEDVVKRRHDIQAVSHVITDEGRAQRRMGTRGSVCTANVLEALPEISRTREQLLGILFVCRYAPK